MITPSIVKIDGVKTPANAPNFLAFGIMWHHFIFVKIIIIPNPQQYGIFLPKSK
jgi:hypothetical protein